MMRVGRGPAVHSVAMSTVGRVCTVDHMGVRCSVGRRGDECGGRGQRHGWQYTIYTMRENERDTSSLVSVDVWLT
jgi:hypothetical protein